MNTAELQERLIDFSVKIIKLTDTLKKNRAGIALVDQISRSSISSALNYGEASGAESSRDFLHKMQIVLKELKETWVALRIIEKASLSSNQELLTSATDECNQLISIFVKSITTSKNNQIKKRT